MTKCFEIFSQCFWPQYTGQVHNLVIIPFIVPELCPFKLFVVSCSRWSFPWPIVLKFFYNVFDHNTQVKNDFGYYVVYGSGVIWKKKSWMLLSAAPGIAFILILYGSRGICGLWTHSTFVYCEIINCGVPLNPQKNNLTKYNFLIDCCL